MGLKLSKEAGTIDFYFDLFLKSRIRNGKSVDSYKSYYGMYVADYFRGRMLASLTFRDIAFFVKNMYEMGYGLECDDAKSKNGPGQVRLVFYMLKDFFGYAAGLGVTVPPMEDESILISARPTKTFPVLEEELEAVKNCGRKPQAVFLCLVGAYMGFKESQALSLKKSCFETEGDRHYFISSGWMRDQMVRYPVPDVLVPFYNAAISADNDSDWVFSKLSGKKWGSKDAVYQIKKLVSIAGCRSDTCYQSFRMYFASAVRDSGKNMIAAEKMMGVTGAEPGIWKHAVVGRQKRKNTAVIVDYLNQVTGGLSYFNVHGMLPED